MYREGKFQYRKKMPAREGQRRKVLSQNFLRDRRVIQDLVRQVNPEDGKCIVELGAGAGAITKELLKRGVVKAVEIDKSYVGKLRETFAGHQLEVVEADIMNYRLPADTEAIVSNVPFHLSTDVLRHLFEQKNWKTASLLLQWEVARKRASESQGNLVTVSWWPWFSFRLVRRVPPSAFHPQPRVAGGILVIERRPEPLVKDQKAYQKFVARVFTGRGRGIGAILSPWFGRTEVSALAQKHSFDLMGLPRDLSLEHWVALFEAANKRQSNAVHPKGAPASPGRPPRKFPQRKRRKART